MTNKIFLDTFYIAKGMEGSAATVERELALVNDIFFQICTRFNKTFPADVHVGRADNLVLVKFGFSALSVPRFFGV